MRFEPKNPCGSDEWCGEVRDYVDEVTRAYIRASTRLFLAKTFQQARDAAQEVSNLIPYVTYSRYIVQELHRVKYKNPPKYLLANFVDAAVNGYITNPEEELNAYIAMWHDFPGETPEIHEWLGMTFEEYATVVKDPRAVHEIVAKRKKAL